MVGYIKRKKEKKLPSNRLSILLFSISTSLSRAPRSATIPSRCARYLSSRAPPPVSVGCQKLSHDVVAHWRLPESWIDARSSPRARGPRGVGGPEQQRHGRPIGRRAVEELELTDFHEREGHLGSHHPVVPDADVAVNDFPYRSVSTVSAVTRHGHARSRMRSQERRSWMGGGDEKKKGLMANCWIIRIYEEGRLAKQITKW